MGMYATIKGNEIKYSGLLAKAGSPITKIENGVVTFERDQVFSLAVNLADEISKAQVQASEPHTVMEVRSACDKLLAITDWIDETYKGGLTFA